MIRWWLKKLDQTPSRKQVQVNQPADLLQTLYDSGLELEIGEDQINTKRDQHLCHDGVIGITHEGFDLQVLLDPLEEQFHLPSGLVNICDGLCGQFEIVR